MTKNPLESLAPSLESLQPDVLLDKLTQAAVTAVDTATKEKFGGLARDLEKALETKKAGATEAAQSDLGAILGKIKTSLSRPEKALVVGSDASKPLAEQAKETAHDLGNATKKGIEAVKSGKIEDAQAAVAEVGEKIGVDGKKLLAGGGIAAIGATISEAIGSVTTTISGLIEKLLTLLKTLWSGIFGGGAFGGGDKKPEEKPASVEKKPEPVKTPMEKIRTMSSEEMAKVTEKMAQGVADDLSERYLGGAKLSPEKLAKIQAIIKESGFDLEKLQSYAKRIEAGEKITVADIVSGGETMLGGATNFMWSLALSGIIPLRHIAYEAITTGSKTAVGLTFAGYGLPPMVMSVEELQKFMSKFAGPSGSEKSMALVQLELYRPMGIFWSLTSGLIANMASGAIALTDTASGANGIPVLKGVTGFGGNYESVFKEFEILNKKFESFNGTGKSAQITETLKELKSGMKKMTDNWKILSILEETGYDQAKFLAHPDARPPLIISENINKLRGAANFGATMKEVVGNAPNRPIQFKDMHMFFGGGDGVMQKYLRQMDEVRNFQSLIASADKGGLGKISRLRDWTSTLKLIRQGDVVSLHLENADDIKNFQAFKKFLAAFPEGIRGFGAIFPAGAFVVTMSNLVTNDPKSGEIVEGLKTVFLPIYGGWQLVKNFGVSLADIQAGKLPTVSEAGLATLGVTVMTLEGARLAGGLWQGGVVEIGKYGKIGAGLKTIGKTVAMHPLDIVKSVGYISRGGFHMARATPAMYSKVAQGMAEAASKLPKKGKIALIVATILGVGATTAYALSKKNPDELAFQLQKDGILDGAGELTSKFFETFESSDSSKKGEVLVNLFGALVDTGGKRPKVSFDAKSSEFAIVASKAEERLWWQSVLDTDTHFRDVLTRMGIQVLVICPEDVPEVTKTTEKVSKI